MMLARKRRGRTERRGLRRSTQSTEGERVHGMVTWAPDTLEASCRQVSPQVQEQLLSPHPHHGPSEVWNLSLDSEMENQWGIISRVCVLLCWGSAPLTAIPFQSAGGQGPGEPQAQLARGAAVRLLVCETLCL